MGVRTRNTYVTLVCWMIVLVVFLILFFQGGGPSEWGNNRAVRVGSAVLFGCGYIVHFITLFRQKKEPLDERTSLIQLKSTNVSLVITIMYVFIFSITIYTKYTEQGTVPASWFWLLGYTTIFITYIVNSAAYIILERQENGYGDK